MRATNTPTRRSLSARGREVGVVTEMLLTKAEQVSDDGRAPLDYAYSGRGARAAALLVDRWRDYCSRVGRQPAARAYSRIARMRQSWPALFLVVHFDNRVERWLGCCSPRFGSRQLRKPQ